MTGSAQGAGGLWRLWNSRALYPDAYVWFIVVSTLDLLVTGIILILGGQELNPVARQVHQHWDLLGLSVFKFIIVATVISLCQAIGRLRWHTGRSIAWLGVGVTTVPVIFGATQLLLFALTV